MKKTAAFLCLILSLSLMGCSGKDQTQGETVATNASESQTVTDTQTKQEAVRAVYLKNDQGALFINLDQESPFTGTLPQDITDEDGLSLIHISEISNCSSPLASSSCPPTPTLTPADIFVAARPITLSRNPARSRVEIVMPA